VQIQAATRSEVTTQTEAATWIEAWTEEAMVTEVVTRTEVATWTETPRRKVGAEMWGQLTGLD
jgi:hypothetical protein